MTTVPPTRGAADAGAQVQEALAQVLRWAGRRDIRRRLLGAAAEELSQNDVWLLTLIEANGPVRFSDLADAQGVDKSTITPQVRRLEEHQLIERQPASDRRVSLLTITSRGRQVRHEMATSGADLFNEALQDWSAEDRDAFAALFTRLADQLLGSARR
jgi:DNA-binding MarR family transcriptional regulator